MKFCVLPFFILCSSALNILLTSEDSWVTKNVRSLYGSLREKNHNVLLVAPLRHSPNQGAAVYFSNEEYLNGNDHGDFSHLLYSNQFYYKNIDRLNKWNSLVSKSEHESLKSVRKVIPQSILTAASELNQYKRYKSIDQDPLDENIWYVDASPLMTIITAVDQIIPTTYPDFNIDLVITGPKEGSATDKLEQLKSGVFAQFEFSLMKKLPTIMVSTNDESHVYYHDESVGRELKKPLESQNLIINDIIDKLEARKIESVSLNSLKNIAATSGPSSSSEGLLPKDLGLIVNIPSLSPFKPSCLADIQKEIKLVQTVTDKTQISVPKIEKNLHDGRRKYSGGSYLLTTDAGEHDHDNMFSRDGINGCGVGIAVHHVEKGDLQSHEIDLDEIM